MMDAERLLHRYPGRGATINAALAACWLAIGERVPESLGGAKETSQTATKNLRTGYISNQQREEK